MSKQCEFCGKKPQTGNYVSHSNIKTKRVFNPNLQNVRHQSPTAKSARFPCAPAACAPAWLRNPLSARPTSSRVCGMVFQKSPVVRSRGFFLLFEEQTLPQGHDTATTPPLAHTAGHIHPFAPPSSAQA